MVTTGEIRGAVSMALRDVSYDLGPIVNLVSADDFEETWPERGNLMKSQIKGADLVLLSRADLVEENRLDDIFGKLKDHCDKIDVLSVTNGRGMGAITELIR